MGEFKISYKRKIKGVVRLNNNIESIKYLKKIFDKNTIEWNESVIVVCLDHKLNVIGWYKISEGSITSCVIDIRKLFQIVLLSNATRFILAHNHPSGDLTPSIDDIEITKQIKKGSKILNLCFIEHFIITKKGYKGIINEK